MSEFLQIHPLNPQSRLIQSAAEVVRAGGLIVYPTDCGYALGCHIGDKMAMERIRALRRLDDRHNLTLVCRDLSQIASYAKVDNSTYRLLKAHTPGAYTFILRATHEVPRRLQTRRKTIGIRVPDHPVAQALLAELDEPLMSASLILPGETLPMTDAEEIEARLGHSLDLVINSGYCGIEPSTVVDLVNGVPEVLREGKGPVAHFVG